MDTLIFGLRKLSLSPQELLDSRKGVESRSQKDPLIESHAARCLCFVIPAQLGMMFVEYTTRTMIAIERRMVPKLKCFSSVIF